jgi:hypothetical protein
LQAAKKAGFPPKTQLISEPEAAAMHTIANESNNLKLGDTVVVVDCGGGTVDLISYKICQLDPALEVEECTVGTGGMCGSAFINFGFEEFLLDKLGKRYILSLCICICF